MQKLPTTLYRAEQIRELERIAIEGHGISGVELMGRAGYEVFQCIRSKWPNAGSVAVFCGGGNNAGDGYIVAKLASEAGLKVSVYTLAEPETLQGEALMAYRGCVDKPLDKSTPLIPFGFAQAEPNQSILKTPITVIAFQPGQVIDADVIVDALLGTGLDRPVTGLYADAIHAINDAPATVIAVDIPSGLQADTGNVMACAVKADCTVTFIGLKQGLFTGQAAEYCGELVYSSLAVPDAVFQEASSSAVRVVQTLLPTRHRCAHKGDYGHVLIIGGERGFSGAALLSGEAALRTGAGLVSIATRLEHSGSLNLYRPELMCHGVENAWQLVALLEKANVVVLGPGLGQSDWAKELFIVAVASGKPLVIDADGLNLLAAAPVAKSDWILTPHPGEAASLLNCSVAEIQQDRFAAVSAIQRNYHGVVVLKGAGTLIASGHEMAVSATGNPGMASGGMGDVLSGVIAGLLAQGLTLKDAAQQGVYKHGLAADLAAEKDGERGLLASDLMPYLRQLVN